MDQTVSEPVTRTKKEKQVERREAFMQSKRHALFLFSFPLLLSFPELGPSTRHFSKSHERRMKRKAKEQLAGNTMDDLQTALASLDKDIVPPESDNPPPSVPTHSSEVKPKAISRIGKIGKGKSSTLSKAQRKRLLCVFSLQSDVHDSLF